MTKSLAGIVARLATGLGGILFHRGRIIVRAGAGPAEPEVSGAGEVLASRRASEEGQADHSSAPFLFGYSAMVEDFVDTN
jgi:hypothetical protein